MKAKNFDFQANAFFNGVGYLKELGEYAGYYYQEAYEILGIEEELEGEEWCDICISNQNVIYAVYGDVSATSFGDFAFKKISDGDTIEKLGKTIAQYNVYYHGTTCVNYSIRFIELRYGILYVYNTKEREAYVSSEEELLNAKEEYKDGEEGYWE